MLYYFDMGKAAENSEVEHMILIFFSLLWKKYLKCFFFWWEKRNMEIFFTVQSCPARFFMECLSHPLLLFSGQTDALEQEVIQHMSEHMDQIQLLLWGQNVSVCEKTELRNAQHQNQVKTIPGLAHNVIVSSTDKSMLILNFKI